MKYENPQLLSLAQFAPHCMACGKVNEGDVVPAHRNEGKSMGSKNPDFMWAALCSLKCHYELDQGNKWSRDEKRAFWMAAYWRTQMWLWTSGLLTIAVSVASTLPPPRSRPKKPIAKRKTAWPSRKLESAGAIPARKDPWPKGRKLQSRPLKEEQGHG